MKLTVTVPDREIKRIAGGKAKAKATVQPRGKVVATPGNRSGTPAKAATKAKAK